MEFDDLVLPTGNSNNLPTKDSFCGVNYAQGFRNMEMSDVMIISMLNGSVSSYRPQGFT